MEKTWLGCKVRRFISIFIQKITKTIENKKTASKT